MKFIFKYSMNTSNMMWFTTALDIKRIIDKRSARMWQSLLTALQLLVLTEPYDLSLIKTYTADSEKGVADASITRMPRHVMHASR
jgi:hypothetical protein